MEGMSDVIELGLEGFDTAVEKGFHKIPDGALSNPFHRTKKDKSSSKSSRPSQSQTEPDSDSNSNSRSKRSDSSPQPTASDDIPQSRYRDRDRNRDIDGGRRTSGRSRRSDPPQRDDRDDASRHSSRRSSRRDDEDAPRSRDTAGAGEYYASPYYTPQTGLLAYAPPSSDNRGSRPGSSYANQYPYSGPYDPRVRYPTPPPGVLYGSGGDRESRRSRSTAGQRRGGRPDLMQRSSSVDYGRGGGGNELQKVFSDSDRGLGIGMLGAVAGGLLAQEAGLRSGKSGKKGKGGKGGKVGRAVADPIVLTLLGAAIGGLGANALEKRFGDKDKGSKYDDDDDRDVERERDRNRRRE